MIVWRLARSRFAERLDGEGNRRFGARWNSPGRGVLYCSEHLSLCVLEALVHLDPAGRLDLPAMMAIRIFIPQEASLIEIGENEAEALSASGDSAACRAIGDDWLARSSELCLRAPSFVVPQERNVMVNPQHPGMTDVRILDVRPFTLDPRLAGI